MSRQVYRENSRGSGGGAGRGIGGRRRSPGQSQSQKQRQSQGYYPDVGATRNQSGTSAIISIPSHPDLDNDSVSVLSDPSAAWATAAANTIAGLLGGAQLQPPTGANGGADEEYDYYCQEQNQQHQQQGQRQISNQQQPVQYSWCDTDIEQPQHRRSHEQHRLQSLKPTPEEEDDDEGEDFTRGRSYLSSTPSTGAMTDGRMDDEAVELALRQSFQNRDKDRRKVVSVITNDDPDFWSIADGGGKGTKRLNEPGCCRRHIKLLCILACLVLMCAGAAVGLLLTQPWNNSNEEGQSTSASLTDSTSPTISSVTSGGNSTETPSMAPSSAPSGLFSLSPTSTVTAVETTIPSASPTEFPTTSPTTIAPTPSPTQTPTQQPTTNSPTPAPTPTPIIPTSSPTATSTTATPTSSPSSSTMKPTLSPSLQKAQNPDPEEWVADNKEGTPNNNTMFDGGT